MHCCLQIKEESILSKTDEEHRTDIDALFSKIVLGLRAANLPAATIEYRKNSFNKESLLTESRGHALHFLTMPILAYIRFDLEREQIRDVVDRVLDPVIEAWLNTDTKKKVALEVDGGGKLMSFFKSSEEARAHSALK
jgi:hypothetical protein